MCVYIYVYIYVIFPGGLVCKESACNTGDLGSIPGLRRSPGGGCGNPLQYSCLENPHGQRSLVGCSPWGHKESDTTGQLSRAHSTWNLKEWYGWGCLQGRNRDEDIENRLVDTMWGAGSKGWDRGSSTDMPTLPCIKPIAGEKLPHNTRSSAWCCGMT